MTEDSIKVGDAALALDPLSSSGVQKAIQSALAGSVVVNTLLQRPRAQALARQFYRESLSEASTRHRAWARGHYAQVAASRTARFWRERAAAASSPDTAPPGAEATVPPDAPLRLSPAVDIVELPCVVDRFIEERPAVRAPSLGAPVAYLGDLELAPAAALCAERNDAARACAIMDAGGAPSEGTGALRNGWSPAACWFRRRMYA